MKTSNAARLATLLSMTACLAAGTLTPASAQGGGGGGGVSNFGDCSNDINTTWILTAEPAGTEIKVQAQVFARILDETWKWHLTDNGQTVARGTGITNQEHQDRTYFRIRKTIADQPGSDRIVFKATRVETRQICRGNVTL